MESDLSLDVTFFSAFLGFSWRLQDCKASWSVPAVPTEKSDSCKGTVWEASGAWAPVLPHCLWAWVLASWASMRSRVAPQVQDYSGRTVPAIHGTPGLWDGRVSHQETQAMDGTQQDKGGINTFCLYVCQESECSGMFCAWLKAMLVFYQF